MGYVYAMSDFLFEVIFGAVAADDWEKVADGFDKLSPADWDAYEPWQQAHLESRGLA
jgi:hypothetical protein